MEHLQAINRGTPYFQISAFQNNMLAQQIVALNIADPFCKHIISLTDSNGMRSVYYDSYYNQKQKVEKGLDILMNQYLDEHDTWEVLLEKYIAPCGGKVLVDKILGRTIEGDKPIGVVEGDKPIGEGGKPIADNSPTKLSTRIEILKSIKVTKF